MNKAKPYFYVRFRWIDGVDMKEAAKDFDEHFSVETMIPPTGDFDLAMFKEHREELKVSADTLRAFLSPKRAVLYQKHNSPFTSNDLELRKRIIELYPRDRVSPLPFFISTEPKFEIEE